MPDDRTVVTELATALGTVGEPDVTAALKARNPALVVGSDVWDRLTRLHRAGTFASEFAAAFANGLSFLHAPDALRGRTPVLIEWTGGRRPPGDEVAPVDLRIDHVYLISCKYQSRTIANASPARLFDGLLATSGTWEGGDWYETVANPEYRQLYDACRSAVEVPGLPDDPAAMTSAQRQALRLALPGRAAYPQSARDAYALFCKAVSERSADRWAGNIGGPADKERLVWRLLRIGNAPYFLLGADPQRPVRLRVASPWDWRQAFELVDLEISPGATGQPQVDWVIRYRRRPATALEEVRGHVEIRWSHGRFAHPPEAKVYLDTPTHLLPGYFALEQAPAQAPLWS